MCTWSAAARSHLQLAAPCCLSDLAALLAVNVPDSPLACWHGGHVQYCSPTRRSFLTGRFPVNINPDQSGMCDNFSPLEFTWLPDKLKAAGYQSHFVGKGHLGYTTSDHLPINRGYESHVGYLGGAEDYYQANFIGHRPVKLPGRDGLFVRNSDFWHDHAPGTDVVQDCYYSTNYYSRTAVSIVENHTASTPLFLDLRYQGVHGPYEEPPLWEQAPNSTVDPDRKCGPVSTCQTLRSMVAVVDSGIANLTLALRAKKMYDNTLIIFTADNGGGMGGTEPSNNYPLRGMKGTPWDGGSRAAAFVSGGFIPAHLRGTENSAFMHVADWYPTLCVLAGVSPTDSVMFAGKIRPIDGIDAWPTLMGTAPSLGREYLPTTNQSLIYNSTWKLLVAAPSTHWFTPEDDWIEDGASLNGTASGDWSCKEKTGRNISTQGIWECMVCTDAEPCLFNLLDDPGERTNLATQVRKRIIFCAILY